MIRQLDFYFDLMSPFAYLAHQRLPGLAGRYGYTLRYWPIDLPAAKRAAGNSGPPNVKIPVKLRYLKTDLDRWAQRYGVPLIFPPSLDSTLLNKAVFFAIDRDAAEVFVRHAWHAVWGEGSDMSDPALLRTLALALGWDAGEVLDFVYSPEGQARYDASNRGAQERGVFGTPTMMIGDDMWWGNDRLDFLEAFLTGKARQRHEQTA
ncbi:2-hydroxychromene-2-carboxylate isomerase [Flagellatimonas centrodinii]|uniref:2-hydroxychromene-2-carboxylate isomerase n=1 Tax=Flagellatimonas centrodinii TaxID=2806210 RepID=UPI001FF00649|nr:2-hydroxychromene-2-carboxylate isomerase [Flagellatimonas centrodinii]ULQ47775.1 2-hydroxychromene-2-carboxylate isomerase [Flagellatimonas centrodinii]